MNIEITIFRRNLSNVTDTLFTTLIPLEEYKLDKKKFKEVVLSNDEPFGGWGLGMSNILYINQVFLFVVVHSVAFFIGKLLSLRLNFVFSEIKTADVVKVANCVLNRWKCVSPVLSFYIPKANNQFVS